MSDITILPHATAISEFSTGLHGDCVETAMAVASGCAHGVNATPASILQIVHSLQTSGVASSNGATTINAAHDWFVANGYHVLSYVPYGEPFQGDWLGLLREHAGTHPIVLNVANAQALTDVQTGVHDEVGVHYHAVCVVGKQPDGYIVCDGDNPQSSTRFQIYPRATIEAAIPCGMVVIDLQPVGTPVITPPASQGPAVPQGWHDDGSTLTAPNGVTIVNGFRGYFLAHPEFQAVAGLPIAEEYATDTVGNDATVGKGSEQYFQNAALYWRANDGQIGPLWIGALYDHAESALADLHTQLADSQDRVNQANAVILELRAQLAATPPTPAPIADPDAESLVALIQKLAKRA